MEFVIGIGFLSWAFGVWLGGKMVRMDIKGKSESGIDMCFGGTFYEIKKSDRTV